MELAANPAESGDSLARIDAMLAALASSARGAKSLERRLTDIGAMAGRMFDAMKFDFLFDPTRQLLSIGYRVTDGSLDPNCYDLLASEARLASFVAIAKGDVPARHWFRLGRPMTPVDRGSALISWSGSMFEYLMPSLVMRAPVRESARTDQPISGSPADEVWRRAWSAVGCFGIRIQRARSRTHLPVLELRDPRARP